MVIWFWNLGCWTVYPRFSLPKNASTPESQLPTGVCKWSTEINLIFCILRRRFEHRQSKFALHSLLSAKLPVQKSYSVKLNMAQQDQEMPDVAVDNQPVSEEPSTLDIDSHQRFLQSVHTPYFCPSLWGSSTNIPFSFRVVQIQRPLLSSSMKITH